MPNALNKGLLKTPVAFIKKRAVRPVSSVMGQSTSLQATDLVEENVVKNIVRNAPISDIKHTTVRQGAKIVNADFKEEAHASVGAVVFEGHMNKTRADLVPIYFCRGGA